MRRTDRDMVFALGGGLFGFVLMFILAALTPPITHLENDMTDYVEEQWMQVFAEDGFTVAQAECMWEEAEQDYRDDLAKMFRLVSEADEEGLTEMFNDNLTDVEYLICMEENR